MARQPARYADPYLCGVALGLVLLAAFVVSGRGLGASGAFAAGAANVVGTVAPTVASNNFYFDGHRDAGALWRDWLVVELAGVMLGGWLSAKFAGRLARIVERGSHTTIRQRLLAALAGGAFMGVGAVFARGCTSGQALTGGALLSVGSWLFVITAFAMAYLVAFTRRSAWT
jgi:uncharacterized protein